MTLSAYDVDKNVKENRILFWLRLDYWRLCDAALLFADINPESVNLRRGDFTELVTLKNINYNLFDFTDEFNELNCKFDDLRRILFNEDLEHDSPQNWIDRALNKKIAIPWLDFAIQKGFYKSETSASQLELPIFDKNSSTYPIELDLALQAWRAVTSNLGKGKAPKAQIIKWLDANTKLSVVAKERVATVANWNKTGGSPRSD